MLILWNKRERLLLEASKKRFDCAPPLFSSVWPRLFSGKRGFRVSIVIGRGRGFSKAESALLHPIVRNSVDKYVSPLLQHATNVEMVCWWPEERGSTFRCSSPSQHCPACSNQAGPFLWDRLARCPQAARRIWRSAIVAKCGQIPDLIRRPDCLGGDTLEGLRPTIICWPGLRTGGRACNPRKCDEDTGRFAVARTLEFKSLDSHHQPRRRSRPSGEPSFQATDGGSAPPVGAQHCRI